MDERVKQIVRLVILLIGVIGIMFMIAHSAEASDTDGLLTRKQCLRVMNIHGDPCVHKIPVFASFGIGKTPVSGKQKDNPPRTEGGNNWFGSFTAGGDIHYVARNKTRYAMDGTPSQCTDPCSPCLDTGYCKYQVEDDGTFYWVSAGGN